MSTPNLANRALLARLTIRRWTGRKLDKRVSVEACQTHGASETSGRFNKVLIAPEDVGAANARQGAAEGSLKDVQAIADEARGLHYSMTLPWIHQGSDLLANDAFLEYSGKMRALRERYEQAVDAFVAAYPSLRAAAKVRLNGMFSESDYPAADAIRSRFTFKVSVGKVPEASDFRTDLGDAEVARIRQEIEEEAQLAATTAAREAWSRVYDAVNKAAAKLGDVDAIFRDSLIGNLRELIAVLPILNLTGDPDLDRARREIESRLLVAEPDELRTNTALRKRVADDAKRMAQEIDSRLASMAGILGGAR